MNSNPTKLTVSPRFRIHLDKLWLLLKEAEEVSIEEHFGGDDEKFNVALMKLRDRMLEAMRGELLGTDWSLGFCALFQLVLAAAKGILDATEERIPKDSLPSRKETVN